ncbi:S8 family peptidase [Flavobacterium muglaense]|uniref:S8 family serine peptidase n=1 Tax=Flavobacterium muglaense TaxID=2764716 RepID=A0A923N289_9FLAO|nr:S8 family serine peptidase [Flavobacterium muglaense]MBC5838186.1 S8 family serine peptidase [Flavobacterium muglaense]MBC5844730.1 S8 family serine peptidase [Flavobacterium muglaense]
MKKGFLFFFMFLSTIGFAQEDAWVYFNTKTNAQPYYDTPLLMLSQRSIDRRVRQSIALDLKDVPIDVAYINQIKLVAGLTVKAKSKWLNAIHVRGTQAVINSLKNFSFVNKVDFANKALNQTGKVAVGAKNTSQNTISETKVAYAYGTSENQIKMLNGHVLHEQNYTGTGKIIAVMDAGFPGVNTALPFKRLRDNNQILGGYDYVSRNDNFYTGDSHGTLVLSTMGGYQENALVGTAPDASYYLFITEDANSENPIEESLWVEAAEKADSLGVDVINTSLGYFEYDNTNYNHTYSELNGVTAFMSRGAEIAFSRGMIVVASAGNEGTTSNPHVAVPADAVSVLAIGAVSATKIKASFSSIGPSYDGRIKPDLMAQGVSAVVSDPSGNISTADGTSFSGPIMAGMIASFWQAFPQKTNKQIRDLVVKSADRYTSPSAQYGYGIPNFSTALNAGSLGVDDFNFSKLITYPNPTFDYVSFTFPESISNGKVIIYSFLGQKVLEQEISGQTDSVSLLGLTNGTYIYKIESDTFSKSGKVIKQ